MDRACGRVGTHAVSLHGLAQRRARPGPPHSLPATHCLRAVLVPVRRFRAAVHRHPCLLARGSSELTVDPPVTKPSKQPRTSRAFPQGSPEFFPQTRCEGG